MKQYICNKAAVCKSENRDICMHIEPHERNHLCGLETEQDPTCACYKTQCNPILTSEWD